MGMHRYHSFGFMHTCFIALLQYACTCMQSCYVSVCMCQSLPLPSLLQPPSFDPDTTDDPNFYLIRFSRNTGEDIINLNIPASELWVQTFNQLAKGTVYIVKIDVVNDAGNGTMFSSIQRETLVDCKLFLC